MRSGFRFEAEEASNHPDLGIARSTVHFHVEQARRKLGARNRAQLAALAVAQGLAEP